MALSVAFQCDLRFELFTAQITEMRFLCVVPIQMGLEVTLAATCVVTQAAEERLQACTDGHMWK